MTLMEFTLWVPGKPKPKDRPRTGRGGHVYTPKATTVAEEEIALAWLEAGAPKFDGPVWVEVRYYPEGQNVSVFDAAWQSKVRGDLDNLVKLTLDGLQGSAFDNDKQVVAITSYKQ